MMVKQTVGLPYSQSKQNIKITKFKEIILECLDYIIRFSITKLIAWGKIIMYLEIDISNVEKNIFHLDIYIDGKFITKVRGSYTVSMGAKIDLQELGKTFQLGTQLSLDIVTLGKKVIYDHVEKNEGFEKYLW